MGVIYLFSLTESEASDVVHCPLLSIVYTQTACDLSPYNLLVVTSKKTIDALEYLNIAWNHIPIVAVSGKTAEYAKSIGGIIERVSQGNGMAVVEDIKQYYADKRVAYLSAKEKSCDISLLLKKEGIACDAIELYRSECHPVKCALSPEDILIFTSPSNVKCFLKNYRFFSKQNVIAIGETTKAVLPENVTVRIPGEPSIEACIQLARTFNET